MDSKEYHREVRRQRRLEVLGNNDPRCGLCGEDDDRVLELHHVAGRKYDDATVIVCRNCHRRLSDGQYDHPKARPDADPLLTSIGHFLLGLADMLHLVAERLIAFGEDLLRRCITGGELAA
jgi:hypothetical protein